MPKYFRRVGNLKEEEIFTRFLFAFILIISFFFEWGRWSALILGILFLISALQGFCLTCVLYRLWRKTFLSKKTERKASQS